MMTETALFQEQPPSDVCLRLTSDVRQFQDTSVSAVERENAVLHLEARTDCNAIALQRRQNLVQQIGYSAEINTLEQIGKCAEQIAKQAAWLSRDVEHHFIQVNHQSQQVQIKWAEFKVQDRAASCRTGPKHGQRDCSDYGTYRLARSIGYRPNQRSNCD